jgi:PHD/YefM family antitoxin component YafN of YafNO toxin-antitoxin module
MSIPDPSRAPQPPLHTALHSGPSGHAGTAFEFEGAALPRHTYASREIGKVIAEAKRLADDSGPVGITDHGKLTHILMSARDYRRMARLEANSQSLLQVMQGIDGAGDDIDIEFESVPQVFGLRVPDFD